MAALNNLWMGQPRETMVSSMLAIARLLIKCGCYCICFNAPLFERQSQRLTTRSCQGPLVASSVAQCSVLRGLLREPVWLSTRSCQSLFVVTNVAPRSVLQGPFAQVQCGSPLGPVGPFCASPLRLTARSCQGLFVVSNVAPCSVL